MESKSDNDKISEESLTFDKITEIDLIYVYLLIINPHNNISSRR